MTALPTRPMTGFLRPLLVVELPRVIDEDDVEDVRGRRRTKLLPRGRLVVVVVMVVVVLAWSAEEANNGVEDDDDAVTGKDEPPIRRPSGPNDDALRRLRSMV